MAAIHNRFEEWFGRIAAAVYDRRFAALLCMLLLSGGLASQAAKITIDTRDETFFYEDDPALIAYNDFRDRFGQDDTFIIALRPLAGGLDRDFFALLRRLHNDLERSVPHLQDITSLVNGRIVRAEGDTLIVEDLMKGQPETEEDAARILRLIDRYPLYESLLVAGDRSMASILIKAKAVRETEQADLFAGFGEEQPPVTDGRRYLSNDESLEITRAVKEVLAAYRNQEVEIYFSGTPAVVAELQLGVEQDLKTMIPLSLLLIVFFLALLFRRLSGVIFPLTVVFLSLVSTLGVMAIAGIPVTLVTQILPSFLLIVGIADSVHVLTIFFRMQCQHNDKRQAIINAMRIAGLPVLMTSLTTAMGLFSFVLADVASVGQLGLVAPVGVMLALVYTVILLPALIGLFPLKLPATGAENSLNIADRAFSAIARFTTSRPLLVSIISGMLLLAVAAAASSVRFSHNALTWFPEDSPIRRATNALDAINGGSVVLEVLIDSGQENGFHHPDLLKRMDRAARTIPGIEVHGIKAAKAWSLADVLKETNRALHQDRDAAYVVPADQDLVAQELILFEASGSDDLEDFTTPDYRTGRLSIMFPFRDAILYKDYLDRLTEYLNEEFPSETIIITGKISLFIKAIKNVVTSMAKSYAFAVVIITLLMVLMVGRIRIGLMSMVANVVPLVAVLGLMGLKGIPLDLSTILIGSLILGLVVDDTIHFLHHFRRAFEETGEVEAAVRATLFSTGRAIFVTSLVLSSGFFIYTAAYLENNVRYGLLSGSAVLFALAADFFLVPALLSLIYGKGAYKSGPRFKIEELAKSRLPSEGQGPEPLQPMRKTMACLVATIFMTFMVPGISTAGELTAREVMERVDARDDGVRSVADMTMLLIDRFGKERTRTIRSFGMDRGEERLHLMFFLAPADVRGTGFLTYDYETPGRDDDQWLYLPALKKTKRIAGSDKSGSFMGSDFTYADLTRRRLDDYTYAFSADGREMEVYGHKAWVIESTPVRPEVIAETGYTKSILLVRQDNLMVVRAIHFAKDGGFLKYFDVRKMEEIDGVWTGLEIHMTRKKGAETVHRTILILSNVKYNQEAVNQEMFTVRTLEKGL